MRKMEFRKSVFACCCAVIAAAMSPALRAAPSQWTFHVSPYLWALNMNGTVQAGNTRAHVNETFSDVWSQLDFAAMLWLEADYDHWGIFFNSLYAELSKSLHDGPDALNARNRFGVYSGGVSYRAYQALFGTDSAFTVEPYAGFRYTTNDTRLNLSTPSLDPTIINNQYWTDPIVGARLVLKVCNAWTAILAGDVGGTNASTQHSYNVIGLVGYTTQSVMSNTTIYVGYRLLDQLYKDGSGSRAFVWNMKLFGPVLGVSFSW